MPIKPLPKMSSCTELEYVIIVHLTIFSNFYFPLGTSGGHVQRPSTAARCNHYTVKEGEDGYCYTNANGEHIGLNNCKLKIWASAIVSV